MAEKEFLTVLRNAKNLEKKRKTTLLNEEFFLHIITMQRKVINRRKQLDIQVSLA